jgi:hypothetical protein
MMAPRVLSAALLVLAAARRSCADELRDSEHDPNRCPEVASFATGGPLVFIWFFCLAMSVASASSAVCALLEVRKAQRLHRERGQTVDGVCVRRWSTEQEGLSHSITVRYCVPMPMPSSTGAQFYRVTKDFNVPSTEWAQEGQAVQVSHITGQTGDARSAVLRNAAGVISVWGDGQTVQVLTGLKARFLIGLVFAGFGLHSLAQQYARVEDPVGTNNVQAWGCAQFWLCIAPMLVLPLVHAHRYKSGSTAQVPSGMCEEVATTDLSGPGNPPSGNAHRSAYVSYLTARGCYVRSVTPAPEQMAMLQLGQALQQMPRQMRQLATAMNPQMAEQLAQAQATQVQGIQPQSQVAQAQLPGAVLANAAPTATVVHAVPLPGVPPPEPAQ